MQVNAWNFAYSCMKLQQHRGLRLTKMIFWEKLFIFVNNRCTEQGLAE